MSRNPYGQYGADPYAQYRSNPNDYSSQRPMAVDQSESVGPRSHWSLDYSTKQPKTPAAGKGNFVERFSPPQATKSPGPYAYDRSTSVQSSYHDSSLRSYHDSPDGSTSGRNPKPVILEKTANFRKRLDMDGAAGTRSRILLFMGLCGCMLLLMLIATGIWIKLDIVKKRPITGLNNVAVSDVRAN